RVCFALTLWNGHDNIPKERLFGLTGNQGNHGEDVKELYYYLDSTPTHSYMRMLYKYPQRAFPYAELTRANAERDRRAPELEILDTKAFDDDRYFDVFVEYAKADAEDIYARVTVINRGPDSSAIVVAPTLWFRNDWSWGSERVRPSLWRAADGAVEVEHPDESRLRFYAEPEAELAFTENETNAERLFGVPSRTPYVKDGIGRYIVEGDRAAVNPAQVGTKVAAIHRWTLGPGESKSARFRLSRGPSASVALTDAERVFDLRRHEADRFYAGVIPDAMNADPASVMRQAFAGMLWSKQFYHYIVKDWLDGDSAQPRPPDQRRSGRNAQWGHLYNADVISMPDKWEYPWYAAWDLAFHVIPIALIDADFAKEQLLLMLREWYMHPNGQIPAYEWALGDVNPPVHAWASLRVYKIEKKRSGKGDRAFLARVFHKLLLNFTWWVNRKDQDGKNVFQGGFLGLDNIGVFDRSAPLPTGGHIEQSDGTSWMAMYCLNMLAIALELAGEDPTYEDVASKFWEHFIHISHAMNTLGLWNEQDGFYYDILALPSGERLPMKVRSMVGLIPLFAVETLEPALLERLPAFRRRFEWFIDHRADLHGACPCMRRAGEGDRRLLAIVNRPRLERILAALFDERAFLSPHGVRSLSREHADAPYRLLVDGKEHRVDYEPAESASGLFGGNSNWRGPIWFPVNFLLIESLQKLHHYYGDDFTVELPTGSGRRVTLAQAASELSRRLINLFLRDDAGNRRVHGKNARLSQDDAFRDLVLFYE
ncbi:MAG: glucosidase, partial [Myxococcales bacterium]|nr:glucosidase [Myxococcales bacterium]